VRVLGEKHVFDAFSSLEYFEMIEDPLQKIQAATKEA